MTAAPTATTGSYGMARNPGNRPAATREGLGTSLRASRLTAVASRSMPVAEFWDPRLPRISLIGHLSTAASRPEQPCTLRSPPRGPTAKTANVAVSRCRGRQGVTQD